MRYLLLTFLCIVPQWGRATENYLEYHRRIICCEEQFLFGNNISLALSEYKKLFSEYKKPFAKDCFIALQLACTTSDTANTVYFFQKAFERGVSWTAIEACALIGDYFERHSGFKERIERIYQPAREQWQKGINAAVRTIIIGMKLRDDTTKWNLHFLNPKSAEYYKRSEDYIAVVDSNSAQLIRLTRRYGFLGDNILGFCEEWPVMDSMATWKKYGYGLYSYVDQIFLHQCCCFILLQPELEQALKEGEISPAMYATIHDWAISEIIDHLPTFRRGHSESNICDGSRPDKEWYNMSFFNPSLDENNILFVDSCRAKIGLASVAHLKKKKEYEKSRHLKLFFGAYDCY